MLTKRLTYLVFGGLLLAHLDLSSTAAALIVGGGGGLSTDCLSVFDAPVNTPVTKPRKVVCVDGDPTCDADGAVNGSCSTPLRVCANSTDAAVAACSLSGVESIHVEHALDNGDPKFDPDFQALQAKIGSGIEPLPATDPDVCSTLSHVHVFIKGPVGRNVCHRGKKKLRLTTVSTANAGTPGRVYTDRDALTVICGPSPDNGCDPQTLFAGTFDRIQKQIFNQSCAVSSCHDSQSHRNDLILEVGAAYTNLVNVGPFNGSAFALGWQRVTPGDASASYLYHKLTGDLPDSSYGVRMPHRQPVSSNRAGRKLHPTLIELIRLWIDAGAPQSGWVAGTS
jgi:hypothetical protein